MIVGYTTGVFDLFHIGHLKLLQKAKAMCDCLIVGVTVDELVAYKGVKAFIPFEERLEIIQSLQCVDVAIAQREIDKVKAHERLKYDLLFVGDDWFGSESWTKMESDLGQRGVKVVYFPYTTKTSSTKLRKLLDKDLSNV